MEPGADALPIPYEDPETYPSFWSRLVPTIVLAFKTPLDFFNRLSNREGFLAPWTFYLLLSLPTMLLMLLFFSLFGVAFLAEALSKTRSSAPAAMILAIIIPAAPLIWLACSSLAMFLGGALLHGFLAMWGGLRPGIGIRQTIRATGYTLAIISLLTLPFTVLSFIPCLGVLFSLASMALQIAAAVFLAMGLAKMHGTDTWRGVCAVVVTPILIGFVLIGLAVAAAIAIAAGAGMHMPRKLV